MTLLNKITIAIIAIAAVLLTVNNVSILPMYKTIFLIIGFIIFAIFAFAMFLGELETTRKEFITIASAAVLIILPLFISSNMVNADSKSNLLHITDVNVSTLVFQDQRAMTRYMASKISEKVIGVKLNGIQISSQYELDMEMASVQNVKGKLNWVIPVDYRGLFKWLKQDTAPGFVMVSATDPSAKAELIMSPMAYTGNSYFNKNIERLAFFKSGFKNVETHFEVNDDLKPYYISLVMTPTVFQSGLSSSSIIITDALSGESEELSIEETLSKYPWIDRLVSEFQTFNKIEWFGELSQGWLNTIFGGENINIPTSYNNQELWFVNYNNQSWYFTGMTSNSSADKSLVSGILVNTKTLETLVFDMSGISDENGATEAIFSSLGSDAIKWEPVLPQPFVINGKYYWGTSIVSQSGIFQKVALIQGDNQSSIFVAKSYDAAIKQVLSALDNSNVDSTETITINKAKFLEIKRRLAELNSLVSEL